MRLHESQAAIADWVRAPEGVARALEEAQQSSSRLDKAALRALVESDERLDATARLEIYANAYFYRILGVLADDYEALSGLLGDARFNDLVTSYLVVEPSRHPSLRYAGARLPDFIALHPAASGIREQSPWAAELSAFEWARVSVFDAPDAETLTRARLALLAPEDLGALMLRTGPWLKRCTSVYAVSDLWKAGLQRSESGPYPVPEPEAEACEYLIWRASERVRHRGLERIEAEALSFVEDGVMFAELCEWVAERVGDEAAPALAAGWLTQWLEDELLLDTLREADSPIDR